MSAERRGADVIRLTGLGGVGRHGVLPEERRTGQTFKADVAMHVDTRAAAGRDDLGASVDYSAVAAEVVAIIEGEPVNLIETLAARIADAVLAHPAVERVEVTVHKPEAPVGVPFSDVEVSIVRGADEESVIAAPAVPAPVPALVEPAEDEGVPAVDDAAVVVEEPPRAEVDLDAEPEEPVDVVLGLGGNVGDVRATLRAAIDDVAASGVLEVVGVAPLAKTAAVLQPDAVTQADFLNTVVLVRTTASPRAVLAVTRAIENAHGRVRGARWGERTLDIDVITYGSISTADPELSLPHPRANERAFVLLPWAHLDPDAFLPGLGGGPVAMLADTAPDRDGVRWLALDWYLPQPESASRGAVTPEPDDEDVSTSRVDTGDRAAAALPVEEPDPEPVEQPVPEQPEVEQPEPAAEPVEPAVPEVEPVVPPTPEAEPEPAQPEPEPEAAQAEPEPESPVDAAPEWEPASPAEPVEEPEPEPPAEQAPAAPEPAAAPSPAPWDEQRVEPTRIRPRWEPLRREDPDQDR